MSCLTVHFSTPLEMVDTPFDSAQGESNPERGSTPLTIEGEVEKIERSRDLAPTLTPSVVRLRSPSRGSREDRAESRSCPNRSIHYSNYPIILRLLIDRALN